MSFAIDFSSRMVALGLGPAAWVLAGGAGAAAQAEGGCNLAGFSAPTAYPSAGGAVAVAAVGPGPAKDLVVASGSLGQLWLHPNNGSGGFLAPVVANLEPNAQPAALGSGAFGGGRDLAVVERGLHRVSLRAAGAGPTPWIVSLPGGTERAGAVVVANLDGTGGDDLLVALEGDLFGRGGGVAQVLVGPLGPGPAQLLPAPPDGFGRVLQVGLADLDGDGDLDAIALRARTASSGPGADGLLLWENAGGGGFVFSGVLGAGQAGTALTVGDFDGNGRARVAVALESFPPSGPALLRLYRHDGTPGLSPAQFQAADTVAVGSFANALASGDAEDNSPPAGPPDTDVAAVHLAAGGVALYRSYQSGPEQFTSTSSCPLEGVPVAMLLTHLNGDGALDLVVLDGALGELVVHLSNPPALAQTSGAGCAGTLGLVPQIGASGLPLLGSTTFAVTLNQARPNSAAFLALSPTYDPLPIGFGCTLYPGALLPLLPLGTNGSGSAVVPLPIPPGGPPFAGLDLHLQFVVADPFGSFLGTYALSNTLRLQLGN